MTHTFTDIFCGAGGSSIGLTEAGLELKLAANHWDRAIETHSANFRDADHLCADVNNYDMRRLPKTDILWASPICTEISPAGGRRRRAKPMPGQGDLLEEFGPIASSAFDRTRATAFDVIRATEVHRYLAVIIENVVEFATDWELFQWWLDGMVQLGYNYQTVCVSSAHIGDEDNPWAPQWRDRLYIVFTRLGIPLPDVAPRPIAWCETCSAIVQARQSWKKDRKLKVGKYRTQYVYRCPNSSCRHAIVEPYVLPASSAIDWTNLGSRIGDRPRPLAAATIRRIEAGLRMFAQPTVVAAAGNTYERPGSGYYRAWPAGEAPLNTRIGTTGDGLAVPPLLVRACGTDPEGSEYQRVWPADQVPVPTRLSSNVDGILTPPMLIPAGGTWNDDPRTVDEPFRTRTVRDMEGVLTPPFVMVNRTHNVPRSIDEPLAPVTTGNSHGVVTPEPFLIDRRDYSGSDSGRVRSVQEPMGTVTSAGRMTFRVAVLPEPFVTMLRANADARGVDEPLSTVSAAGRHHGLTVPPGAFYVKNYGGHADPRHMVKGVGQPLGVVTGQDHHALVIPYRRAVKPTTTAEPLHTLSTRESAALVQAAIEVDDCHFRMLMPREHLRAQRFPNSYIVTGNQGEQTMQAGNAVSANVAHWLARAVVAALDSRGAS